MKAYVWSTRWRVIAAAVVITAAVVCLQTDAAWQLAGDFLVCDAEPRHAELIVVLGGDFYGPRVDRGVALSAAGYAPQMIVSGPPYGKPPRPEGEWAIDRLKQRGIPTDRIVSFGHRASSTPDEAVALCHELSRRSTRNILLVTDAYHSRRAAVTLRVLCPVVSVRSIAAADQRYNRHRWWTRPSDRDLVASEWKKLAGTIILAPRYWLLLLFGT